VVVSQNDSDFFHICLGTLPLRATMENTAIRNLCQQFHEYLPKIFNS
jgi:hypothetical protein